MSRLDRAVPRAGFACFLFFLTTLGVAGSATPASTHALDPSLLEIEERAVDVTADGRIGRVDVSWRSPLATLDGSRPEPVLPCSRVGTERAQISDDGRALVRQWQLRCDGDEVAGDASILAGSPVAVEGLNPRAGEVLVRWTRLDGTASQVLLDAREPRAVLPTDPTWSAVAVDYLAYGFDHILEGFDHLAFVFGLFLLVSGRRLVATVTAFTVGHSLTLGLVVLGALTPPSSLVETTIAASILVLAVELARRRTSEVGERAESWLRRRPWTVAGAFGLLHGMGFAGALRETGLPQGEIPLALAGFNVGIELGQLAFVAGLAVGAALLAPPARALLRRLAQPIPTWHAAGRVAAVYSLGTLAAYWTLERLGGMIF